MNVRATIQIEGHGIVEITQVVHTLVDIITPRPELSQTYNIASNEWTGGYTSRSYWYCFKMVFGESATKVVKGIVKLIGC
jgi:hypothetical protein